MVQLQKMGTSQAKQVPMTGQLFPNERFQQYLLWPKVSPASLQWKKARTGSLFWGRSQETNWYYGQVLEP